MKRGLPEDVAGVAIYLASKASGSVCSRVTLSHPAACRSVLRANRHSSQQFGRE
jgi:hypothetical protein